MILGFYFEARPLRGQLLKVFERIIGHFQVDGWEIQTVWIDYAIVGQIKLIRNGNELMARGT